MNDSNDISPSWSSGKRRSRSDFSALWDEDDLAGGDAYDLDDGAEVAVVGGGPTGTFFSIFALQMAELVGKEINITIYDPKDFNRPGPAGCNRCAGIISELLVQTLAVEGINLPDAVVWKGINSYRLHTTKGSVSIETPSFENTIAAVYRGGGPKNIIEEQKESFDSFLLDLAAEEGAIHKPIRIDKRNDPYFTVVHQAFYFRVSILHLVPIRPLNLI